MVSPVVSGENVLTSGNALDVSQGRWSSLEVDGSLTPPQPARPPSFPPTSSPPPLSPPSLTSSPSAPNPPPPAIPPTVLTSNMVKRKIQRGVQERVYDFWKEKIGRYIMQGDYLALIIEEGDSITWKSFMWDIPQGVLKFAINAGINTLPSSDNLKRWGKRVSDWCTFCGNTETLAHILSNCSAALNQGRYTWRHNSVLNSIINLIRPHLKSGMVLFSDMPGFQAPHGGTVPPHVLVTAHRPDIFIYSESS